MVRLIGENKNEQKVIDDVAEYGWHCVHIAAEAAHVGYSFTVGLFHSYGHPELMIFGLPRQIAHQILVICADAAKSGSPINLTQPTDALLNAGYCEFAEVPASEYHGHVGYAIWYYQKQPFPLYQIVWPSKTGLFPWHPDACDEFREVQPVIGVRANQAPH